MENNEFNGAIELKTNQIETTTVKNAMACFYGNFSAAARYFGVNRATMRRYYYDEAKIVSVVRYTNGDIAKLVLINK